MKTVVPILVMLVGLLACSREKAAPAAERATYPAARIVSVGSAVTETIYALGAGDAVVGVDTSSLFPEAATKLPQVGYQRALSAEGILALKPTLLLVSAEAGPPAVLEQLRSAGVRVELADAKPSAAGAKARITRIASLLERDPRAVLATLDTDLERAAAVAAKGSAKPKVVVLYARGANALHVFGKDTAATSLVELAGGTNVMTAFEGSRPLTSESLVQASPDVIVIPSRGLESVGGPEALLAVPGVAQTPAGKTKRIVAMDDLLLLGVGPRTGQAAAFLGEKLQSPGTH